MKALPSGKIMDSLQVTSIVTLGQHANQDVHHYDRHAHAHGDQHKVHLRARVCAMVPKY